MTEGQSMITTSVRVCLVTLTLTALLGLVATDADASSFKVIYTFPSDGTEPIDASSLIAKGGVLYGIASTGGSSACEEGCGTLFKLTTQGVMTTLYSFTSSTEDPSSLLPLMGSYYISGNEYLATISSIGVLTRLVTPLPKAGKLFSPMVADGSLLAGTAPYGGLTSSTHEDGAGLVFTLRKSGTHDVYNSLYSFTGNADGAFPTGAPVDVNGTLYGVTQSGGANNSGVFYSVSPTGAENVLFSFNYSKYLHNASSPVYAAGSFYFTIDDFRSGTGSPGTLYRIDTTGAVTVMHTFTNVEGAPLIGLTYVNGTLYGGTTNLLYSLDATGTFKILHEFAGGDPHPTTALVSIGDSLFGAVYGTSSYVYKVTP